MKRICKCGSMAMNDDPGRELCDKCWRDARIAELEAENEWAGEGGILDWQKEELTRMAGDNYAKREQCKMAAIPAPSTNKGETMTKPKTITVSTGEEMDYQGGNFLNAVNEVVCYYQQGGSLSDEQIAELLQIYGKGLV